MEQSDLTRRQVRPRRHTNRIHEVGGGFQAPRQLVVSERGGESRLPFMQRDTAFDTGTCSVEGRKILREIFLDCKVL